MEKKYYQFSGTWSWGTWAYSQGEAEDKFANTFIDDICIDSAYINIEMVEDMEED